jgi:hypothetical protein
VPERYCNEPFHIIQTHAGTTMNHIPGIQKQEGTTMNHFTVIQKHAGTTMNHFTVIQKHAGTTTNHLTVIQKHADTTMNHFTVIQKHAGTTMNHFTIIQKHADATTNQFSAIAILVLGTDVRENHEALSGRCSSKYFIFPSQSSALMRFSSLSTTLDHKCNGTVRQSGAIC